MIPASATRRFVSTAAAVAAVGMLVGCGSSGDASSGSTTSTVVAVGEPASTDTPASDVSEAATTVSTPSASTPDVSACATGKWIVVADQVARVFDNSPMRSLPGFSVSVEGEGHLDLRSDGTYTYVPDFTANITVNDMTGVGAWAGTLEGTWQIIGDQLTMAQTSNDLSGSVTLMGSAMPMPALNDFNGTATVIDCQPMTFTYRIDTPLGAVDHTLVLDS